MNIKIGTDPEFFVKKDGKHVSAFNLVEGTKKNPQPVDKGAVQVDGMALEFNIEPASTSAEFKNSIQIVLANLRRLVPQEYEFDFSPVAHFDPDYIAAQPEVAKQLGCEPDFNAYTRDANPAPDAAKNFRTASGHIHIGWTEDMDINDPEHVEACQMLVKQLDVTLGMFSILIDPDRTRRELYGKAGAYRPKSYGVEYRVMSNAWLKEDWMIDEVFKLTTKAFNELINGHQYYDRVERDVQLTINTSKEYRAQDYLRAYKNMPRKLSDYLRKKKEKELEALPVDLDELKFFEDMANNA